MTHKKMFATAHHTNILHNVLNVPNTLAKWKGIIPLAYHQWLLKLYNTSKEKLGSRKRVANDNVIIVSELQPKAVSSFQSSKKSILAIDRPNWHEAHGAIDIILRNQYKRW